MKLLPLVSTEPLPAAKQEQVQGVVGLTNPLADQGRFFGEAGERASYGPSTELAECVSIPSRPKGWSAGQSQDERQRTTQAQWIESKAESLAGILKLILLIVVTLLAMLGTGTSWFIHTHPGQTAETQQTSTAGVGIANSQATATANIILSDPLSQNIHNWPVGTQGSNSYVFLDRAYHITDTTSQQVAPAILANVPDGIFSQPFAYTLTMQEIKGDDTSINNSFGMIIRFNHQNKGGRTATTFYSFEVVNKNGGEYQFWKYNDSQGTGVGPWTKLWHLAFGHEFHQGHGLNTCKIFVSASTFTFTVNGKKVGTTQDSSVTSGAVGMLVNLKGTEVAFSNLVLTYN